MSGLCKVEMSGFIQAGRRDGTGANPIGRERGGAIEGFAGLLFQERVQVKAWNDLVPSAETISEKDLA
jgi:hypothetical protein